MARGDWRTCTKNHPCPVCGKPDWCGVASDGAWVICMRVADRAVKQTRNGGFLHRLKPGARPRKLPIQIGDDGSAGPVLEQLAGHYRRMAGENPKIVGSLAEELGLPIESLHRLQLGWSERRRAFSFPMRDAANRIVGIRLRRLDGSQYAVRGSRDGLFVPDALDPTGPLLIAEGATDTAALLSLGFAVIGRPSCLGGVRQVVGLVRRLRREDVVIVADRDAPGQRGAEGLANALAVYASTVRVIQPPEDIKDARAWVNTDATRETVQAAIERAPLIRLRLRGGAR